jgi:acyl CoA:acetate/3-ketoacid CoA transferase beta subunit
VVATLDARRTVPEVPYITSPGLRVSALVTDLGTFERREGEFVLTAVPEGPDTLEERIERVRERCGWPLDVADQVSELAAPTPAEVETLRRWDPQQRFLRPDGAR